LLTPITRSRGSASHNDEIKNFRHAFAFGILLLVLS